MYTLYTCFIRVPNRGSARRRGRFSTGHLQRTVRERLRAHPWVAQTCRRALGCGLCGQADVLDHRAEVRQGMCRGQRRCGGGTQQAANCCQRHGILSCRQGYAAPMLLGGEQAIRAAHGAGGFWSATIRIQQLPYILFPARGMGFLKPHPQPQTAST